MTSVSAPPDSSPPSPDPRAGAVVARVLIHSVAGCIFYGAFVTKMLSLSRRGMPGWLLPVTGGLTFTALIVLWLTSALWVFGTHGLHF